MKMRMRVPLYARILAWSFLNLALIGTVFTLLFLTQFQFDLEWVFATSARNRVETMRNLIIGDLNITATDEWPRVVERYGGAYRIRLGLFDEGANHLVGDVAELPPEVRARIRAAVPSEEPGTRWVGGPPLRVFLRTGNPERYWLLLSGRVDNWQLPEPIRLVLVAESSTLSGGGLILDPAPWFAVGAAAVVFSFLFWLPFASGITRTIRQIAQATRQLAEGKFDVRAPASRRDELGELGQGINQMAGQLEGMLRGQKRFLGDIAHELCSPLARLQMALGILEQRGTGEQQPYIASAGEKAAQIAALVNELLAFSKASLEPAAVKLEPVKIGAAVAEAIRRESAEAAGIRIELDGTLAVLAEPELLTRALGNLLRNAIRHGGNVGPISVAARRDGLDVVIAVSDSGPGVPAAELSRIFDAFYRVDASRTRETGGAGIGLSIVKTCIEACNGTVSARNGEPAGLEVTIRLQAA
jgi:two-component system sensor histidine kinase CpxA